MRGVERAAEHSETFGHIRESRRPPVTPGGHRQPSRDPSRGAPARASSAGESTRRGADHDASPRRSAPAPRPAWARGPRRGRRRQTGASSGRAPGGPSSAASASTSTPSRPPHLLAPRVRGLARRESSGGAGRPVRPACRPRPGRAHRRWCPCGCRPRRRRWARRRTTRSATRCSSRSPDASTCTVGPAGPVEDAPHLAGQSVEVTRVDAHAAGHDACRLHRGHRLVGTLGPCRRCRPAGPPGGRTGAGRRANASRSLRWAITYEWAIVPESGMP